MPDRGRDKNMVLVFSAIFFSAGPYLRLTARNPAGSEQEMTEAAQIAQAVEFIDSLFPYLF